MLLPPVLRAAFRAGAALREAALRAGALRAAALRAGDFRDAALRAGALRAAFFAVFFAVFFPAVLFAALRRAVLVAERLRAAFFAPPPFRADLPLDFRAFATFVTPFRSARQPGAPPGAAPSEKRVACTLTRRPCDLRRIVAQVHAIRARVRQSIDDADRPTAYDDARLARCPTGIAGGRLPVRATTCA
jgi:hypothetical protein